MAKRITLFLVIQFLLISPFHAQEVIVHANAPFAAEELRLHLEKISGRLLPVVEEKSFAGGKVAYYVGQTDFAKKQGIDFSSFTPEEWLYRSQGENIILTGHKHNGTAYAVWHFLENELGVRWLTFESTFIPKKSKLSFGKLDKRGKPAFVERQIYSSQWNWGLEKTLLKLHFGFEERNRINNYSRSPVRLSTRTRGCHNFYSYVDPKKYFKEHPEYFSMDKDGKRFYGKSKEGGGQICLSNPEVARVAVKHLKEYIAKDRAALPREKWPVMYDISQMDQTRFMCLCPECKKIAESEGGESALVLLFVNRVAAAIAAEYPEILLRTFAYSSTDKAPKTFRPAKNVIIRWCDLYSRSDCYRPLTSKFNSKQREVIAGWQKAGARLALWDYWNLHGNTFFSPPRVETLVDAIGPDMKYFRAMGFEMLFIESGTSQFVNPQNFIDLQTWLAAQLMDDPDKNAEALIAEYVDKHYGPAAPKVGEALNLLRDAVRREPVPMYYLVCTQRQYQTASFINQFYGLLKEARALTPAGSDYRCRVEKELLTPMAVMLVTPGLVSSEKRKALTEEYKSYRMARIEKYAAPEKKAVQTESLKRDLVKYGFEMKIPDRFKQYPPDKIRLLAFPYFSYRKKIIPDPDSETGYAMVSPGERPSNKHIMKRQAGNLMPQWFGVYDYTTKKSIHYSPSKVPQDEKYHWYRIGKFEVGNRSIVWGFFWRMDVKLDQVWSPADGVSDYNVWTIWISAKFTGPGYVRNSQKENRIYLDQVVLVKE